MRVTPMDEAKLIEKLRLIEALFEGATTEGEKIAAELARERLLKRLIILEKEDPPIEYRFSMADMWMRKVFVALLRRYGIKPYRYKGQRYTTVMAKVSRRFVDETLWPQFQELSDTLHSYLSEVTERIVTQVIHQDSSEAAVVDDPLQLSSVSNNVEPERASSTDSSKGFIPPSESEKSNPPESSQKKKRKKHRKRKRR